MKLHAEICHVTAETSKSSTFDKCSRWAVHRRVMQDGSAYSLEDYPYVAGVLDSRAKKNWVMKGAQVGLTEAGITIALYELDRHGRDVLYYFPTGKMAERFSKTRFASAINLSPYLSSVVTNDSVVLKQIGNATLHILGANSMANLKGTASGRLMFDELDEWTERQIYLAEERASGQKNDDKIIWGLSTPKYPNMGIHKQYLTSTREEFEFPCPHCGKGARLHWEDSFEVRGEAIDDPRTHESYIKCPHCQKELPHRHKKQWLREGKWVQTNPDADPALSRGFWLPQFYSPTVSPGEIAIAYLRGFGDEDARREFHNSKLALPYIEDAHKVTDEQINACVKTYALADPNTRPKSAKDGLVTLGIDQGGALHHWVAVKWRFDLNRSGDPNDRAVGRVIGCGRIIQDDWDGIHGLMRAYQVRQAVIDYFPEPTNARVFARRFTGVVHLCQYVRGVGAREVRTMQDDTYGTNIVRVDKTGWLTKTLGRVMACDIEFPVDLPLQFREQLKAPTRTVKKAVDGTYVAEYVETGQDHYAHALNYAEIALKLLNPGLHTNDAITKIR